MEDKTAWQRRGEGLHSKAFLCVILTVGFKLDLSLTVRGQLQLSFECLRRTSLAASSVVQRTVKKKGSRRLRLECHGIPGALFHRTGQEQRKLSYSKVLVSPRLTSITSLLSMPSGAHLGPPITHYDFMPKELLLWFYSALDMHS